MNLQMQKIRMSHGNWHRAATHAATVCVAFLVVEAMHILVLFHEAPETAAKGVAARSMAAHGVAAEDVVTLDVAAHGVAAHGVVALDVAALDVAIPGREATSLSVLAAANLSTVLPVEEELDKVLLLLALDVPVLAFSDHNAPEIL